MRAWALLMGGLLVWAADFFLLYAIGSIWLTSPLARILSLVVTAAAAAADLWLIRRSWSGYRSAANVLDRWMQFVALVGAGISLIAVVWQGLPAILI